MGATEMLINGFKAIVAEHEARESLHHDPLTYQNIVERLNRLGTDIRETTGFRYETPELMTLFKSYVGEIIEVTWQ